MANAHSVDAKPPEWEGELCTECEMPLITLEGREGKPVVVDGHAFSNMWVLNRDMKAMKATVAYMLHNCKPKRRRPPGFGTT